MKVTAQEPRLAEERDIQDADVLLCSGKEPIGLSPSFCAIEKEPERLKWFRKTVARRLLWVIRDADVLAGMLVLRHDLDARVVGIDYIVVAENMRGQGKIGPRLVRQAQTLADAELRAEARNPTSRRLLEKCGFQLAEELSSSGHPILTWSRPYHE